jgi:predicted  nucleic acid-binding Zn-ribbon protein
LVLGWFEPNPTMLDGVVDSLTSLQNQIDGVNNTISALEQTLTSADNALTAEVAKKADKTDVYTKEEANSKINELISAAQHLVRKVFDTLEEAEAFAAEVTNPADYVYMVKNTSETASDKYTEYLYIDEILEPVGSWGVDLDAYATKNELTVGLLGKVDVEEGKSLISDEDLTKLAGIEAGAEINFISSVDEAIFNVNEGKLEFKSISIDKVDELENLLNDKASVSSVNELIADVSDIEGNIVNISNSITTIEEDIIGLEDSISDLTDMLNSYVKQDAFEAKMTLVDNDLEQLKEALTWVSLDAQN